MIKKKKNIYFKQVNSIGPLELTLDFLSICSRPFQSWPLPTFLLWMQIANSLEKTLILGKIEGRRKRGQQKMRWLDSIRLSEHEFEQILGNSEGQESLARYRSWGRGESDMI